ncbi:DNA topoisomerase IV subunit B [[Mycoplasma] testudinis]|uniref:DNA topoisomerase IV subunit B n=1 Tax=[Mycoplasma] testudinis TaxID=33924 RepID=UPI00047FD7B5|nr:DNA topoisomerase IV subunit B [[Mycoplasma] testudinis]
MAYDESSIKVLKGLDPVRKRPGMYIGSTDTRGLHHLVWEIFDNAIDEVLNGSATEIDVALKKDGSVLVKDNGRGIPAGKNKSTGLSTIDTVYTVLHAGGKFDDGAYKVAGGLHGVGASVVNALCSWMAVRVQREGKVYESLYKNGGHIAKPATETGTTNRSGTTVQFMPDLTIFRSIAFNANVIKERLRESSFLFKGLKINFFDEQNPTNNASFLAKNGIKEYVEFINESKKTYSQIAYFSGSKDKIEVEAAMQFTTDENELFISFANSIKTIEGGSHEMGFKSALTETVNDYARKYKILKERDKSFEGSDIREGLTVVLSVKVPEALISYEGQTKNKLFTQEAKTAVQKVISERLYFFLEENKDDANKIIQKIMAARDARLAARKARENIRQLKNAKSERVLFGKLTPAQTRTPSEAEIFLVEGDSAGGTAKTGRDRRYQAILPLRGKVINVEKTKLQELLKNEEIISIISCLGTGIGEDFDLKKARYHKIVIMTDADTDGAHIQILLLTFFYRYMRPLIENGMVYLALPPLYKIVSTDKKKQSYAWDEIELDDLKEAYKKYEIQRYKGLGEMNSEQLWETTMDPKTRQLVRVSLENAVEAERRVTVLMGEGTNTRKIWINENVDFSMEDE